MRPSSPTIQVGRAQRGQPAGSALHRGTTTPGAAAGPLKAAGLNRP